MEKAYIILAHKLPGQLYRIVERLDDGLSTFFIHIDLKADFEEFSKVSDFGNKVKFIKRENIKWAGFDIIKAVLNGLNAVKEANKKFDRIILLTGQDYPIKSNEYINNFYKNSPYSVFIDYWPIPNHEIWKKNGGMYRVNKYFFGTDKNSKLRAKALNFLAIIFPFLRRKLPYGLLPFGGWAWWTIDMYALNYILQFLQDHPKYMRFHRHTFVVDEMFLHTILLNSKDERLLKSITNNYLRYVNWPDTSKGHPEILRKDDLEAIKASGALYARKFDINKDAEILDLIDKSCLTQISQ